MNYNIILQRYGGTGGAALNENNESQQSGIPSQDKQEWEVCTNYELSIEISGKTQYPLKIHYTLMKSDSQGEWCCEKDLSW